MEVIRIETIKINEFEKGRRLAQYRTCAEAEQRQNFAVFFHGERYGPLQFVYQTGLVGAVAGVRLSLIHI